MDLHVKSEQLLQAIANSMYDWVPAKAVHFSVREIQVVEEFLRDYEREIRNKLAWY